jgi:hypothetical protein
MRRCGLLFSSVVLFSLGACGSDTDLLSLDSLPVLQDDFGWVEPGMPWEEGETHGEWTTVFDGYGLVSVEAPLGSPGLVTRPASAESPDVTHGALVVSGPVFDDLDMQVRVTTLEQLRLGSAPNPWECGWVLWSYSDDDHFYYLALKTNGWELGKADPAYPGKQRFLADGRDVRFDVGQTVDVRVQQVGSRLTVWADGQQLTTFVDQERPYLDGSIGLYTEDAEVLFDDVVVYSLGGTG